ncbi:unnamed protein product [Aureobasidium uvarum]|uniref:Uncharacterized protein n=1 Tax=Aureobasidium uvarum TaxID=2773716 RepID=A0A9N8PU15_9PEZI|nr:unnamed protein product [Aureobasidium uvarum]
MRYSLACAALALRGLSLAQTVVLDDGGDTSALLSNIDPADIAAIQDPEILGSPISVPDAATIDFDEALATRSVLALVATATDAQTNIITSTADASAAIQTVFAKRNSVGGSTGKVHRRDLSYPVDTSSYDIPLGYTPAFTNYQRSTQGRGYLTYQTLSKYDPALCTKACDKISSCAFANIYIEKDPDSNGNPVDVIKCSLYSMPQTNVTATNSGQWRGKFHVIITGSNGYNKAAVPLAPTGYSLQTLPSAINASVWDRAGQWKFIQGVYLNTYDPALCAAACDKQTQLDRAASSDDCNYKTCAYANLYVLSEDGVPKTVVCALYTEATDASNATINSYSASTHLYQVSNSIALTNTSAVAAGYPQYCAPIASDISYLNSAGPDFCTSYLGYVAPTDTVTKTITPLTSTIHATSTKFTTITTTYSTTTITSTVQNNKRQESSDGQVVYSDVPCAYNTNGTVVVAPTAYASLTNVYANSTATGLSKRTASQAFIPVPSSIAGWPAIKVSAACSQVATGRSTTTTTITAATPLLTKSDVTATMTETQSAVATETTCVGTRTGLTGTSGTINMGNWNLGFTSSDKSMAAGPSVKDTFVLTNFRGGASYLYHPNSGQCATIQSGPNSSVAGQKYTGGSVKLAPCGCSAVPPENQAWLSGNLFSGQCLKPIGDRASYGVSGFYSAVNNFGTNPVGLAAGDGACFFFSI